LATDFLQQLPHCFEMKNNFFAALLMVLTLLFSQSGFAAQTNDIATDINAIVAQINAKILQGKNTEKDLANELNAFDDLYAKYKNQKTEGVAQILVAKAHVYLEVIYDPEKAAEIFQQIKRDLPDTPTGKRVDAILDTLKGPVEAEKIQNALVVGATFPGFSETNLNGSPLSIANYKSKVVLVDFWATWCVPCRMELPYVLKTYEKYHDKGFEIIGVSLDDDRAALEKFIKENKMPWPQFFDGNGPHNALAVKYGIEAIPATFLLDGNGKIIGKDLRGEELQTAVANAVAKK
jgi:thiol-disulfide isomerase/thioredoxin